MTAMRATEAVGRQVRCLALTGAVNFRDLGGYETSDGRRVRWNLLYRSDQLADLSEADLDVLEEIGLRTICDLRGEAEREHRPNRALRSPSVIHAIGFLPHRGEEILGGAREGTLGVAGIESMVREVYRRFVTEQSAVFARLLQLIESQDSLPLLYHCTSGRDRTGFATAVILMALGVPRQTIAEDYALSNRYRRDLTFQIGGAVGADIISAMTQAHPDYLAAAFSTIDDHYGSDQHYLTQALGLSTERQRNLQLRLLEPADGRHSAST